MPEINWHIAVSNDSSNVTTVYAMEGARPVVLTEERLSLSGGLWLPTDLARRMLITLDLAVENQRTAAA